MPTYIGNSIQPNGTLVQQNLFTHQQQHQQQWLSQHSRQPAQSEHELAGQSSVQNMIGVVPVEPLDYAQSQVCLLIILFGFTMSTVLAQPHAYIMVTGRSNGNYSTSVSVTNKHSANIPTRKQRWSIGESGFPSIFSDGNR